MYKKTINCPSCECKCDVIVRQTNYDDEIEVQYCPFCSISIEDLEDDYSDEE